MALVVKKSPANAGNIRDTGLIPGPGRSPGGGHGNPFQYSCLKNPIDRGAWWATVHRVAKSRTWLKWLSTHTRELWQGGPKEAMSYSQGKLFNGIILGPTQTGRRDMCQGAAQSLPCHRCFFHPPWKPLDTALGPVTPRAWGAISTKLVDLEQFIFSKHPWTGERFLMTTEVIASKAKTTRKEISFM